MLDLVIVGGGPAACSAAVTARMRNLSVQMVYAGDGALGKTHRADNYPGFPHVAGDELLRAMRDHAAAMDVTLSKALVQKILPMGDSFSLLAGDQVLEARTVLLACGVARVRVLPGEEDLLGSGVSYCATCDGMFYRDKTMVVIASGAAEAEEANYLADLGHVIYLKEKPHDTAGLNPAIEQRDDKPLSLSRTLEGMVVTTDKGEIKAAGVFVLRPVVAMTQMLPEIALDKGQVVVDEKLMTSVPGVFAAGDMIGPPLQVAKAVGDGNVAALSIASYLRKQKSEGEGA